VVEAEERCAMSDRLPLDVLTSAQLFERAAGYAKQAKAATTTATRNALHLLALRYAVKAGLLAIDEAETTQH
jgi:hypothetical protein